MKVTLGVENLQERYLASKSNGLKHRALFAKVSVATSGPAVLCRFLFVLVGTLVPKTQHGAGPGVGHSSLQGR